MKLIIDLMVLCKESNSSYVYRSVRREWETSLVPIAGMEIEDSAWKRPREIKRVTMNPECGYYHLWVGDDNAETKEQSQRQVEMYISHGWKQI
ncbi:hypothetical protein [Zobellella sp. An-6]|uniref:hypothetical protein n=1 Tax=Zobellella sp. An-6 TaxID=3400218 RepID=UPI00404324C7